MTRTHSRVLLLASVLASLVGTLGCQQPAATPPAAAVAPEGPPAVTTTRPVRATLQRRLEQPGSVEAFQQTPVYAKVAGYVQKVHHDIGDHVRQGEVLAELWVPEMVEEVKRKDALVRQAEAEVTQKSKAHAAAEANVKSAAAKVREAEADRGRAAAEAERARSTFERLKKSTVVTQEVIDEARYGAEAAKAAVTQVEAKVLSAQAGQAESEALRDKAKADVTVAEAHLDFARADRDQAKALLDYARVLAPFDGVVTRRTVDVGHFLQATAGSRGEPLFTVVQADRMRVFVDVPEADAVLVKEGDPARVQVQVHKGREFVGKVTRSSWALDARSRTLRVEIDLPNSDGLLRPGMYAYGTITIERADAWTLPQGTVATDNQQTICFVVEGGKAVRTPLQVGLSAGGKIEVLKKQRPDKSSAEAVWVDLTGAEEVVSNPAGLKDGQEVTVSR